MMKRILITGSRKWPDDAAVQCAIDSWVRENVERGEQTTVVHGTAMGADRMAGTHAVNSWWLVEERHPANWQECGPECPPAHQVRGYCPTAGHRRNSLMVSLGADVCLAFRYRKSPGTTDAITKAQEAGIPTIVYDLD